MEDSISIIASGSEYGSDLDEESWDAVFSQIESQPLNEIEVTAIEESQAIEGISGSQTQVLRVARDPSHAQPSYDDLVNSLADVERSPSFAPGHHPSLDLDKDSKAESTALPATDEPFEGTAIDGIDAPKQGNTGVYPTRDDEELQTTTKNGQSPLERFRSRPKKPLSVTDIISPAWCELQYWFSLTKYGRIRKTPAMKQGSKIHKEKEREVHIEVPVETVSKEDRFGLRLWNIIAGLRTLRLTGLTRELEVLGLIDGEVIVGIIDEVTHHCPRPNAEGGLSIGEDGTVPAADGKQAPAKKGKKPKAPKATISANQSTLTGFISASQDSPNELLSRSQPESLVKKATYIVDIKTRKSKTLPSGSQVRPTRMQLMMYRRLLIDLATNKVDSQVIFDRYGVDSSKTFSDTFIAAMSEVDGKIEDYDGKLEPSMDLLDEATTYNNLNSLWAFMIIEFEKSIIPSAVSPLLTVEYRDSSTGHLLGNRYFTFEQEEIEKWSDSEMQWWRGKRDARGVDIEEAYKCGICDFAETCHWRISKLAEAVANAKQRRVSQAAKASTTS